MSKENSFDAYAIIDLQGDIVEVLRYWPCDGRVAESAVSFDYEASDLHVEAIRAYEMVTGSGRVILRPIW